MKHSKRFKSGVAAVFSLLILLPPAVIAAAQSASDAEILLHAELRVPAPRPAPSAIIVLDPDPADLTVGLKFLEPTSDYVYRMDGIPATGRLGELYIVTGAAFLPSSPQDGQQVLELKEDTKVKFKLGLRQPGATVRELSYWKHQANLYLKGPGDGAESRADMESEYPARIFDRFHKNPFSETQVSGVTCTEGSTSRRPVTLETMHRVFMVADGDLYRAKQQLLALLLNIVSGKVATTRLISPDGATVGGAVRHLANLINGGDRKEHREAAEIGRDINQGKMLDAGAVPSTCLGRFAMVRDVGQSVRVVGIDGRIIEGSLVSVEPEEGSIELIKVEDPESTRVRLSAENISKLQYRQNHKPKAGLVVLGALIGGIAGYLIGEKIDPTTSTGFFRYDYGGGPLSFVIGGAVGMATAGILSSLPTTETYECAHDRGEASGSGAPGGSGIDLGSRGIRDP